VCSVKQACSTRGPLGVRKEPMPGPVGKYGPPNVCPMSQVVLMLPGRKAQGRMAGAVQPVWGW